jgi:hypothetical protein
VRAEFYEEDDPERVAAVARWNGRTVDVDASTDDAEDRVRRAFRLTPVVVDDPALRPLAARGESVVQPGSLEWFRTAALTRAGETGYRVRMVPEVRGHGGWDPASAYRTFRQTVAHLVAQADEQGEGPEQAAESRPEGAG